MNKRAALLVGGTSLLLGGLLAGTAMGGLKGSYPVTINTTTRHLTGAIGSTRNGSDTVSYVYVDVSAWRGEGTPNMRVYAKTAAGVQGGCSSTDPALVAAAAATTTDSYVDAYWDTSGGCTDFLAESGSDSPPKAP